MKDFLERLIELVKEDKELHDAAVRLLDSLTETNLANAEYKRSRIQK